MRCSVWQNAHTNVVEHVVSTARIHRVGGSFTWICGKSEPFRQALHVMWQAFTVDMDNVDDDDDDGDITNDDVTNDESSVGGGRVEVFGHLSEMCLNIARTHCLSECIVYGEAACLCMFVWCWYGEVVLRCVFVTCHAVFIRRIVKLYEHRDVELCSPAPRASTCLVGMWWLVWESMGVCLCPQKVIDLERSFRYIALFQCV